MRSSTPMRLHFEGSGLDSHQMSVRELAPSLIALNKLIKSLNDDIHGDKATAQLQVKTLKPGSFGLDLLLDAGFLEQVKDLLTCNATYAFINAHEIIQIMLELFVLKRWLAGRKPDLIEEKIGKDDEHNVEITIKEEKLAVDHRTYNLYFHHPEIRDDLNSFASPLASAGVDKMQLSSTRRQFVLTRNDYQSFIADPEDKDFSENILQNVALLLKSPYFEKDKKWKVLMGDQSIFVSIEDVAFMNQVLSREETFATGDALVADIVMTQSIENNKIVTSYKVTKVLEHKNSLQQLSMLLF
ncbi:hypothetical protein [Parasutterella muris]|uniref:Uncharacterized protein n=3 Tax=Parasutterella TaxID=577310 RepID=A0A6L6YFX3_9BURK|nr:hypothetical protein [Parasutterella muris]MVX56625.1 hypothetical protein [Parasutterella muris]